MSVIVIGAIGKSACSSSLSKCGLQLSGCHNCTTWPPPAWGAKISEKSSAWARKTGNCMLLLSIVKLLTFPSETTKESRQALKRVTKARTKFLEPCSWKIFKFHLEEKTTCQRMLLQLCTLFTAGHCFNFFKDWRAQEYKWLWFYLLTWKDPRTRNPTCEPRRFLEKTSPRGLSCGVSSLLTRVAAALRLWSSVPAFCCSWPTWLMLPILSVLILIPCLALLTWYSFSAGGKSGGNKKNDGVKVRPFISGPEMEPLDCLLSGKQS